MDNNIKELIMLVASRADRGADAFSLGSGGKIQKEMAKHVPMAQFLPFFQASHVLEICCYHYQDEELHSATKRKMEQLLSKLLTERSIEGYSGRPYDEVVNERQGELASLFEVLSEIVKMDINNMIANRADMQPEEEIVISRLGAAFHDKTGVDMPGIAIRKFLDAYFFDPLIKLRKYKAHGGALVLDSYKIKGPTAVQFAREAAGDAFNDPNRTGKVASAKWKKGLPGKPKDPSDGVS